ncbi:MAG TPA: DegT/DnrJ/EryC1/StrS family aminotransferase [Actinomycetota bacterium]|nr:DegT/DnrJ/EryC1/StrS family aminotransferase [Actinomycetota bacterium]
MSTVSQATRPRVPLLDLNATSAEIREELDAAWSDVVGSSAFVGGPPLAAFEDRWAAYCGRRHAVGVANGTDGLELALRALGIGHGDEVIVPTNTFVATVEAVVFAGATPRLIDVDPRSLVIDPSAIDDAITPRTAAVVAVHLHGNMPDMDAVTRVADARGIAVLEDAAQAHGATWRGRPAGSFGVASCFSFYPGKNLGAFGDAGAVVTDDEELAATIRSLANHGRAAAGPNVHERLGRNSRLDTLQAAVLSAKLRRLDAWNERRRRAADIYRSQLPPSVAPVEITEGVDPAYHQFVIRVQERDRIRAELAIHGVDTGIHYPVPCHAHEPFRGFATSPLPIAESAAAEILSLPMFPQLTVDQIGSVCESLAAVGADGPAT